MKHFLASVCIAISGLAAFGGDLPAQKLKVYILAGQSNMQGHGRIEMEKAGDLEDAAALGRLDPAVMAGFDSVRYESK